MDSSRWQQSFLSQKCSRQIRHILQQHRLAPSASKWCLGTPSWKDLRFAPGSKPWTEHWRWTKLRWLYWSAWSSCSQTRQACSFARCRQLQNLHRWVGFGCRKMQVIWCPLVRMTLGFLFHRNSTRWGLLESHPLRLTSKSSYRKRRLRQIQGLNSWNHRMGCWQDRIAPEVWQSENLLLGCSFLE